MQFLHQSVMLKEVLCLTDKFFQTDNLNILDCTLGEAGHAVELCKKFKNANIDCLDCDSDMIFRAEEKLKLENINQVNIINEYFDNYLKNCQKDYNIILFDLGVSMYHFSESKKGFSYKMDNPLDMRLGKEGKTAFEVVNYYSEKEIADIIFEYGEERNSKNIAKNIVISRKKNKIKTTLELEEIIYKSFFNRKYGVNYSTRTFQALRIYVNDELLRLKNALKYAIERVALNGIIIVISFHSLEDRIVKNTFKSSGYKTCKKPIIPSDEEIKNNRQSRSSKLRYLEKILI